MSLQQLAKKFPIGTKVNYYPIASNKFFTVEETASFPWDLPSGDIVIKLKGKTGCYGIEHIELENEVQHEQ